VVVVIQEGVAQVGALQEVSLDPSMMPVVRETAIRAKVVVGPIEDSHSKTNTLIDRIDVASKSRRRFTDVFNP
tara:strand:- start:514 stop:732 length:219 start_codon:yes stop_codon:yes gene_type:complete